MAKAFILIYEEERGWKKPEELREKLSAFAQSVNGEIISEMVVVYGGHDASSLIRRMSRGESLYVEESARLGTSLSEVIGVLTSALKREIKVYGMCDGFRFDPGIDSRSYLAALEHVNDIYNNFLSSRTKAALDKRRLAGVKLGRPVGSDGKMQTLKRNRAGVLKAIEKGMPYMDICRKYKVSFSTLRRFREAEGLLSSQTPGTKAAPGQHSYISPSARSAAVATRDLLCQSGEEVKQSNDK